MDHVKKNPKACMHEVYIPTSALVIIPVLFPQRGMDSDLSLAEANV